MRLIRGAFCFPFTNRANIRYDANLGGGCLYDMGFYPIDFSLLLAGEAPSGSAREVLPRRVRAGRRRPTRAPQYVWRADRRGR